MKPYILLDSTTIETKHCMALTPEREHQLIGDIYDAAMQPGLWEPLLNKLSMALAAKYSNMLITDELNSSYNIVYSDGRLVDQQQWSFRKDFSHQHREIINVWRNHGLKVGEMALNHLLFGDIDQYKLAAGAYYTEVLEPSGSLWMMGGLLEMTDFRCSLLSFHRGPEQQAFNEKDIGHTRNLLPHFRRALQIHRQLSLVRQQNDQLYKMLDRMTTGVLLVNAAGRVCYANPVAETLLSRNTGLSVSARYGLKAADPAEWQTLKQCLQSAIRTGQRDRHHLAMDCMPAGGVLCISNEQGTAPLMLTISPLSEMSGYEDLASDGIAASIFLSEPMSTRTLARDLLRSAFQLSDRECDVCEVFLNTATLEGIADALEISLHTVRGHLKTIYEKTGYRSQAELMKLLLGLTIEFEHIR